MIAERTLVAALPDGSKLKLVSQLLTTSRGIGATVEYSASFFISADGKFWSSVPTEMGSALIAPGVKLENERALWASLEPKN